LRSSFYTPHLVVPRWRKSEAHVALAIDLLDGQDEKLIEGSTVMACAEAALELFRRLRLLRPEALDEPGRR